MIWNVHSNQARRKSDISSATNFQLGQQLGRSYYMSISKLEHAIYSTVHITLYMKCTVAQIPNTIHEKVEHQA